MPSERRLRRFLLSFTQKWSLANLRDRLFCDHRSPSVAAGSSLGPHSNSHCSPIETSEMVVQCSSRSGRRNSLISGEEYLCFCLAKDSPERKGITSSQQFLIGWPLTLQLPSSERSVHPGGMFCRFSFWIQSP